MIRFVALNGRHEPTNAREQFYPQPEEDDPVAGRRQLFEANLPTKDYRFVGPEGGHGLIDDDAKSDTGLFCGTCGDR